MWLVGYAYNLNGMGSWCLETAHALADAGEPVALACSPGMPLPGDVPFTVLRIAPAAYAPNVVGRLHEELHRLSTSGPRVMRQAVATLEARGSRTSVVLLNSTEFFDPVIALPQLVTAWARDASLVAYLSRLRTHVRGVTLHSLRMMLDAVGWWRRDWYAFRRADLILGVSRALTEELQRRGVRVATLHPCIAVGAAAPVASSEGQRRLLIVAESLDLPRKRVVWMLEALRGWGTTGMTLTLVGHASAEIRSAAHATGLEVCLVGRVSREEVQRRMREHDVFLFASVLDDWGYVLAEAMGHGLAVVAPSASPFDEIVGDAGVLFESGSAAAFRDAVGAAMARAPSLRVRAWQRASEELSREAFVRRLRTLVTAYDLHRADGTAAGGSILN